ncbi:putative glutathione S-transferase [Xylariaceae sp. AK1471]|nr:putative glutathione S-transferase [Xylariaceae sp. AK1471]
MSASTIVLFDLGSSGPKNKTWNLNPWKTRFMLNYKGLDYKTEWLEYPDIKPRLQQHFPEDTKHYTIPTVIMPDGTYIMDSWKIAQAIEKDYPVPSLHLDSPLREKVEGHLISGRAALKPIYVPNVVRRLLKEFNHAYWHETRSKVVGMPLDQFEREHGGDNKPYEEAAPHFQAVTAILKEDTRGPFFMGSTISYTDFIWAGFLIFCRRIGDDMFQSVLEVTGDGDVHLKLLEALEPWSARDDY